MPLYLTSEECMFNLETLSSSEARRIWRQSIKDHWRECAYCGSTENLTLDHITPRSKGGSDRLTNVVCACRSCNHDKGNAFWSEWYLNQDFFTTERLSAIIEWQSQNTKQDMITYKPRKLI